MAGKSRGIERIAAHGIGVLRLTLQTGDDLVLDACDRVGIEARLVQGERQQIEGDVAMARERLHLAMKFIAAGIETQADGVVGHAALKGFGIEIARTFVEKAGDQIGAAGRIVGIACGAAVEREIDRDQRQGMFLDQPGLDTARRRDLLDQNGRAGYGIEAGGNGSVHGFAS